jgi:hypothetical protein
MNSKHLLVGALALALAGCAGMAPMEAMARANCSADCKVTVTVAPDGEGCKIDAPLKNHFIGVHKGTWNIKWEITTNGYEFDPVNGIEFVSPPSGIFSKVTGGGKTFTVKDKNDSAATVGAYPYKINVIKSGTAIVCKQLDPYVINDETQP